MIYMTMEIKRPFRIPPSFELPKLLSSLLLHSILYGVVTVPSHAAHQDIYIGGPSL